MNFHYIASQADGKVTEGDFEAENPVKAVDALAAKGLKPISLKVIKGIGELNRTRIFGQKITTEDKIFLTKYLALMLSVGTDLFKAIDILITDFDKPSMKALLIEIKANLEKGLPFYQTFAKYPKFFSPVFVNLVRAGESSGNLENVFEELTTSLQKEQELKSKIKTAITYPVVLLVLASGMVIFLTTFAIPKIANVFKTSNIDPPIFSKIVFTIGLFLNDYIFYITGFVIVFLIALWVIFSKTITGRRIISHTFRQLPLIRSVLKQIALQRFASTLKSLLKAGLPILDSLEITAEAVGSDEIRDSLMRISKEGIAKGLSIGDAFRRESVFPRVIVNLMAISERSGHIENILGKVMGRAQLTMMIDRVLAKRGTPDPYRLSPAETRKFAVELIEQVPNKAKRQSLMSELEAVLADHKL